MIISDEEKNQAQFTLDDEARKIAEREFLQSRDQIFTASTPVERFDAVARNDKAREVPIFHFGYELSDIANLVKDVNQ
jgi:hypothetical protein